MIEYSEETNDTTKLGYATNGTGDGEDVLKIVMFQPSKKVNVQIAGLVSLVLLATFKRLSFVF